MEECGYVIKREIQKTKSRRRGICGRNNKNRFHMTQSDPTLPQASATPQTRGSDCSGQHSSEFIVSI